MIATGTFLLGVFVGVIVAATFGWTNHREEILALRESLHQKEVEICRHIGAPPPERLTALGVITNSPAVKDADQ